MKQIEVESARRDGGMPGKGSVWRNISLSVFVWHLCSKPVPNVEALATNEVH